MGTAHGRLRLWTADGTWQRILDRVVVKDDSVGELEWVVSAVDPVPREGTHRSGRSKSMLNACNPPSTSITFPVKYELASVAR